MKLPAFQFYPGDWLKDTGHLSLAARGGWIEIMCAMHDSQNRGIATFNMIQLARRFGTTVDQAVSVLDEITDPENPTGKPICEVEHLADGKVRLTSRRMVRDEAIRQARAAGGELGGNPNLVKVNLKDNLDANHQANLKPTPSSSSSSSINTSRKRGDESEKKKPPNPLFAPTKAYWLARWQAKYGREFRWAAKYAVALNTVIGYGKQSDAIESIIDGFLADDDQFICKRSHDLCDLAQNVNTYGAAIPPPAKEFSVEELKEIEDAF